MAKRIDLTGQRFGRLLVLRPSHTDKWQNWHWLCLCDCGASHTVQTGCLRRGISRSCGCLQREEVRGNKHGQTHGMSNSPEYKSWVSMGVRCFNKTTDYYHNYGGRGITVCPEWRESFEAFYRDMGPRLSLGHTIDRIDNDGNYEPGNCRWATRKQQSRNTRQLHILTFNNESHCITEWAKRTGMNYLTLVSRIRRGWATERALTTPVNTKQEAVQ